MIKHIPESDNTKYNVIIYDFNRQQMVAYDIVPYFEDEYNHLIKEDKAKIKTYEDLKDFVKGRAMYQFWSRCEWEIILSNWPSNNHFEKWDVYDQVLLNLDFVTTAVANKIDFHN